jgi:hypothetical protein
VHRCDRDKIPCRSLWVRPTRDTVESAGAVE